MNIVRKLGSLLTMDDFFCGAGGETTGAKKLGIQVRHAFNHWDLAIESHNANHPEATHIQHDIGTYDPYKYQPSIIGWFSPECKTFSDGRGKSQKPLRENLLPGFEDLFSEYDLTEEQERSRVTAGDILRHVEVHRYELIVVENVLQFRDWEKFNSWQQQILNWGYESKIVYLNSAFCHPTPQSRDRMYVCFWRKGNKKPNLDIEPLAPCLKCGRDVKAIQTRKPTATATYMEYNKQYTYNCPNCASILNPYYYPAASVIDFSNVGQRIGDRKRPLAAKTMARIEQGLKKYVTGGLIDTAWGSKLSNLMAPMPTQTGSQTFGFFVAPYHNDRGDRTRPVDTPLPTVDGSPRFGMVAVPNVPNPPFISTYYGNGSNTLTDEPLPAVTSKHHHGFIAKSAPNIEDCYFRMLNPTEIKMAMGFPRDYVLKGVQRDQVELAGQAVTPDSARIILERMVESLS